MDNQQPHGLLNDLGWEIYPEGLHNLIIHVHNRWKKPILITENGIADRYDRYRAPFIVAHLQQVGFQEFYNEVGVFAWLVLALDSAAVSATLYIGYNFVFRRSWEKLKLSV